jgi:hypothetical protein
MMDSMLASPDIASAYLDIIIVAAQRQNTWFTFACCLNAVSNLGW